MREPTLSLIWPRLQALLALPLLAAAAGLFVLYGLGVPADAYFLVLGSGGYLLAHGLAALAFGLRMPERTPMSATRFCAAGAGLAVLLAMAVHHLGRQQFGGFDMSIVIDAGWRLYQGQRFPTDFPATTPPLFMLGSVWAFRLGGVQWQSIVDACAVFTALSTLWAALLWRMLTGRDGLALGLAASMAAMALLPLSYWWYNPLTSVAGILFALSSAVVWRTPHRWFAWGSWVLATALLASVKPNVASLLLAPVGLLLLTSTAHRGRALVAGVVALLLLEGVLRLEGLRLIDFIASYSGVASRGIRPGYFFIDGSAFHISLALGGLTLLLLPLVLVLPWALRGPADRGLVAIGLATMLAGVVAFITTGEFKPVDLAVTLVGLALASLAVGVQPGWSGALPLDRRALVGRYLLALALLGSVLGLSVAVTRHRVHTIGPGTFHELVAPAEFQAGFFKGLTAGPRLHDTYAEIARLLPAHPQASFYFGPRLQWAYAAFGQPSPIGQPVWWHPDVAFARQHEGAYVDDLLSGRFEWMVFLRNDYTYYPDDFRDRLLRGYEPVRGFERLDVYRRR